MRGGSSKGKKVVLLERDMKVSLIGLLISSSEVQ